MSTPPPVQLTQQQLAAHVQQLVDAALQQQLPQAVAAAAQLAQQQQQQHRSAAPGGARAAAARPAEPRLGAPPTFDGKASALDSWLAALTRQFAWYAYETPAHDASRIRLASSALTADAWAWFENLPNNDPARQQWDAFLTALRSRFQPVTSAENARAKLRVLQQGKSSVNDYISAFRRLLVSVPTMGEDDKLFAFVAGLQAPIATQLRIHGVKTLDAAVDMAARIGSLGEMGLVLSAAHRAAASSSSSSSHAPMDLDALLQMDGGGIEGLEQDTAAGAGAGEEVDAPVTRAEFTQLLQAMREQRRGPSSSKSTSRSNDRGDRRGAPRGPPKIPHLTDAQVKQYMEAGQCFGCGSKEHRAINCPKRRIGPDGKPTWSSSN